MLRTMSAGKRTGHEAFCGRSAAMVARRSQPGRGPRAGAGAALLLGMVALMMLLGVVAWMTLGSGDRSEEFGFANRSGVDERERDRVRRAHAASSASNHGDGRRRRREFVDFGRLARFSARVRL